MKNKLHLWHCVLALGVLVYALPRASMAVDPGQRTFEKRCSQCHDLPGPEKLTSEEWVIRLESMAPMAGLNTNEKSSVLNFLQSHGKKAVQIVSMAKERKLFEKKCSVCHSVDRVFIKPLTPASRRHLVLRMQERAPDLITMEDVSEILEYLNHGAPESKKPKRKHVNGGGRVVFQERCSVCHSLERVYLQLEESEGKAPAWMHIVKNMRKKAPDWITEKEAKQIISYLKKLKPVKKE